MRLIDADAARKEAKRIWDMWNLANVGATSQKEINKVFKMMELFDAVGYVIDKTPTVDAMPVVRCKDCKWHKQECTAQYYDGSRRIEHICTMYEIEINYLDWFCADGERKDGGIP